MKRPKEFDGTNVEGFLLKVRLYIDGNRRRFPDDMAKVLFVLSLMEGGKAGAWAENFAEEATKNDEANYGTFRELSNALKKAFGDPNKAQSAQLELSQLKQMDNMTAVEFFSAFDILIRKAGYDKADHDQYMIHLLEHNMQEKLIEMVTMTGQPSTYAEFKERTLMLDAAWRRQQAIRKDRRKGNVPTYQKSQPTQQTTQQAPVQTHRDATGVTFGGAGQLMDLDKARALNVCRGCGRRGHILKFCPNRGPRQVRQVDGAEAAVVTTEAAKPPDANELLLCQIAALGNMMKGLTDRISTMETQGFGKPQQ